MNEDKWKVFGTIANCEISSYETPYPPERVVVSTREIANMLNWTKYRAKKAIKELVEEGIIERASCGNPAVESRGEYSELVYEAAPPKNGYAISERGFECEAWKEIYKEWNNSLAEWANGKSLENKAENNEIDDIFE